MDGLHSNPIKIWWTLKILLAVRNITECAIVKKCQTLLLLNPTIGVAGIVHNVVYHRSLNKPGYNTNYVLHMHLKTVNHRYMDTKLSLVMRGSKGGR